MDIPSQDRITPFYFGPPERQLFGLYHTAQAGQERDFGVVLCNPWGQEFMRAHRALSQLALRLARLGFAVLRFDYYGTGDSAGTDADGTLALWMADLRSAIQELKRRARIESVFVAGMRLGASLAAQVSSGRDDIEGLVMWEPVVNGAEYIQDLTRWHTEKQLYFLTKAKTTSERREMLGFGLHETLLADLAELDLLTMKRKPADRILIIENTATSAEVRPSVTKMHEYFQAMGANCEYCLVESFQMWKEDPDKGLVPQQVLQTALDWLEQGAA